MGFKIGWLNRLCEKNDDALIAHGKELMGHGWEPSTERSRRREVTNKLVASPHAWKDGYGKEDFDRMSTKELYEMWEGYKVN